MGIKKLLEVFLIVLLVKVVTSANILGVFPFPSKSHCILGHSLLKGLAHRGHNVTMLTTHQMGESTKNYRELVMNVQLTENIYSNTFTQTKWYIPNIVTTYKAYAAMSVAIFEDDTVKALINSSDKYDVIIYSHIMQTSLLGLSYKFNASTILFSVFGVNHLMTHVMGSPQPAAYVPNLFSKFGEVMTFFQRLQNLFINMVGSLHLIYVNDPSEQKLIADNFPRAPSLKELLGQTKLVLVNSYISLEPIRPILQNMIHIGGYYMDDRKPLSDEVETYLNSSSRGVIYLSFGTNVKYHHMPKVNVQKYLKAFEQLPYDILWKLDSRPPGITSNVLIVPWVSQLSVLAHPNVKAFITHGGKGGLNEAIYHGVPPLLLPCYADQVMNARDAVRAEIGLDLNYYDFTVDELVASIQELITNPKYKKNIIQRSYLIRNQKEHPMDVAEYWVDYVAKNPNATFLQSQATKMTWYQVAMLDVFVVYCLLLLIVTISVYFIVSRLYERLRRKVKVKEE